MDYQVARNYEEYLKICKELMTASIGEDDYGTYVPFDSYEDWENFFQAELPTNEDETEYLSIADFNGKIGYRPEEHEYPVIVVHKFTIVSDFRNGDIPIRLFEWKPIQDLTLKVDEELLEKQQTETTQGIEGYKIPLESFIPFDQIGESEFSESYRPLADTLRECIDTKIISAEGKDAIILVDRVSTTILKKGNVDFEQNRSVRHCVEILPSVHIVVTVCHTTEGLGKESHKVTFDGIIVSDKTTKENIIHFSKLLQFTGLV